MSVRRVLGWLLFGRDPAELVTALELDRANLRQTIHGLRERLDTLELRLVRAEERDKLRQERADRRLRGRLGSSHGGSSPEVRAQLLALLIGRLPRGEA